MANGFQSVAAQETFTVMGNSPDEKAIGSIAELQVKRMLENSAFFEQSFRNTATAEQIQKIGGIATAIYRFAKRLV
jgi:DNA uptake protein ComE-like DNA-binding protein